SDDSLIEVTGLDKIWNSLAEKAGTAGQKSVVAGMRVSMGDKFMEQQFRRRESLMPRKAVAAGDAWQAGVRLDLPYLGEIKVRYECKLKELAAPVAVIETEGKYETTTAKTIKIEGAEVTIVQLEATEKATLKVDTKSGLLTSDDLAMKVSGKCKAAAPGGKTVELSISNAGVTKVTIEPAGAKPGDVKAAAREAAAPAQSAAPTTQAFDKLLDLGQPVVDPNRDWTLIAYWNGDCSLDAGVLGNVVQLESALPEKGIEIALLWDRSKNWNKVFKAGWDEPRVYRVRPVKEKGEFASEIICKPGELNLGDPAVLKAYVTAAIRKYPAKHYAILLSGHGGGWSGMIFDDDAPGCKNPPGFFSIDQARTALRAGLDAAGVKKADLIVFDLCLMSQAEVACEMQDVADVMVASEATVPGRGLPYDKILPLFTKDATAKDIGTGMVKAFAKQCEDVKENDATMSAMDLTVAPQVTQTAADLTAKLKPLADKLWPKMARSMYFAQAYAKRTDYKRGRGALASADFYDCLRRMRANTPDFPAAEYDRLIAAMQKLVLISFRASARPCSFGVAAYMPFRPDILDPNYKVLRFPGESGWLGLLEAIHVAQARDLTPPTIKSLRLVDKTGNAVQSVSWGQTAMEFTVDGTNILWTTATVGSPSDAPAGLQVAYRTFIVDNNFEQRKKNAPADAASQIMPEYKDGANTLLKVINNDMLKVCDGDRLYPATIDYSDPDDVNHIRVPAFYTHPPLKDAYVDLYFEKNFYTVDHVVAEIPQPNGRIIHQRIKPDKDADLTLAAEVVKPDGKIAYKGVGTMKWGSGPELVLAWGSAADYQLMIEAENIAGTSARQSLKFDSKPQPLLVEIERRGGNRYKKADLIGTWQGVAEVPDPATRQVVRKPTGAKLTFTEGKEGALEYSTAGVAQSGSGPAFLDTRGLPTLSLFVKADGRLVKTAWAAVWIVVQNNKATLLGREMLTGQPIMYEKVEGAVPVLPAGR
ncbi:MAG: DUF6263 family protein, partial [Tepidisphaeraceae bacterium]